MGLPFVVGLSGVLGAWEHNQINGKRFFISQLISITEWGSLFFPPPFPPPLPSLDLALGVKTAVTASRPPPCHSFGRLESLFVNRIMKRRNCLFHHIPTLSRLLLLKGTLKFLLYLPRPLGFLPSWGDGRVTRRKNSEGQPPPHLWKRFSIFVATQNIHNQVEYNSKAERVCVFS